MAWTAQDLQWLRANYPALKPTAEGALKGELRFRMLHADGLNFIKPSGSTIATKRSIGVYIVDRYSVEVEWKKHAWAPNAYETGGRIAAVADQKKKSMLDLHVHTKGNALCLADTMELATAFIKGCSLQRYIEEFLIPYLFAQTHYAATGDWLWGELSHDFWGHLEWLGRRDNPSLADVRGTHRLILDRLGLERTAKLFDTRCRWHHPCPCGSGVKNINCHPDIREAIGLIRGEISRHGIS